MMILDHENKHLRSSSAYVMWGDKQLQHFRKFTILSIVRGDTFGFHTLFWVMCVEKISWKDYLSSCCVVEFKLLGWLFSGFVSTALN